MTGTAAGWDEAYKRGDTSCSWFQQNARASLDLIARLGADLDDGIIDVGGGASTFVDALLDDGHTDLTVLDISLEGLRAAQRRLGPRSARVDWLVADLLAWTRTARGRSGTTALSCASSLPTPTAGATYEFLTRRPQRAAMRSSRRSHPTVRANAPDYPLRATTLANSPLCSAPSGGR